MTNIQVYKELREANLARQQLWDPDERINLPYRAMELGGEVGESLNVIKKYVRGQMGLRGSQATLEDVEEELADINICVDLIAMGLGIDMQRAVATKFNKTSKKVGLQVYMEVPK